MKLYFSPSACSLSPHIALREAGLDFQLVKVDLKNRKLSAGGADFTNINPKGYVPVLELDDGTRLTEGPAIVQFIADQRPESGLAPKSGTLERYRLQEWLTYINSEIHKGFSPLFKPNTPDDYKVIARENLGGVLRSWLSISLKPIFCSAGGSAWLTATCSRFSTVRKGQGSISRNGRRWWPSRNVWVADRL
jgi:glutathione S-transferase